MAQRNHHYLREVKKILADTYPLYNESLHYAKYINNLLQKLGDANKKFGECLKKISMVYENAYSGSPNKENFQIFNSFDKMYKKSSDIFTSLFSILENTSKDYFDITNKISHVKKYGR